MNASMVMGGAVDQELDAAQRFVESIGNATRLPAFARNIRSIGTLAADLQIRVELLEKEILKDPALTSRVLRVASCVSQSASIASVKQAIILLGYERVTNLSSSAAVFDRLERNSAAVQDLLVVSVLTANQGLALAVQAGNGRPELAYLCGLFSNLGEVMAACYRSAEYDVWAASRRVTDAAPDGSEAAHFGFAFEHVAVLLATQWSMPPEVIQSLRRLPPPQEAPRDRLLHIAQFGADLTRAIYSMPAGGGPNRAVETLIELYAGPLAFERKAIDAAISRARSESIPALSQMNITIDGWRRARLRECDARATAFEEEQRGGADDEVDAETMAEAAVRSLVDTAQEQRRAVGGQTFAEALNATLAAGQAAGYSRGVLALSNETFTSVRGRIGSGPGHEELLQSFDVSTHAMFGALAAALDHRTDLFVDMRDDDALRYRRDTLLKELDPRCFSLLPLVLSGRLIGCLYFDSVSAVSPSARLKDLLCTARAHLVVAFLKQREGGQAA